MQCEARNKNGLGCKKYAMKNSKYCYIHSFGKLSGVPWYKNSTTHFILGLILAIVLFLLGPSKKTLDKTYKNTEDLKIGLLKQLDPTKILLGVRYAYEFDHYLGATSTFGNEDRIINPDIALSRKYDPNESIRFVFIIANQNKGMPFEDVYLNLIWPDGILEIQCGEDWHIQNTNKRYTYHFTQVNNVPLNTFSGISAKFPGPGEYTLFCLINGKGIVRAIEYRVKIKLY